LWGRNPDARRGACGDVARRGKLRGVIIGVEQTTWDLIGQIGVWFVGFPLLIGILAVYIYAQVVVERRENQRLEGRWGLAATSRSTDE
ncbi:MAG: hypothetical protein QM679_12880, partial [Patulibacter sp.]